MKMITSQEIHLAYESGSKVSEVLETALSEALPDDLNAFVVLERDHVLAQAEASQKRWDAGEILGSLDGVPIAIKDEFDVQGYPTTAGTTFRNEIAKEDSTVVKRLRAAGAIIFGKTELTEIGLGGIGSNPGRKTPKNPWDKTRMTGGSSSGSAAVVAAGIVPMALGSDAGGSIRMPAALCGIYGFKPTFGRIPSTGGALLAWSLDHLGPLASSLEDIALFYNATAGADSADETTLGTPTPEKVDFENLDDIVGLNIAYCPEFADDADDDVKAKFHDALNTFREAGANVTAIELKEVEWIQPVGYVTIAAEAAASQKDLLKSHRSDYNLDTRLLLAVAEQFSSVEYTHAQRSRQLIVREFYDVCSEFDLFLNPTLASTAKTLSEAATTTGEVNSVLNSAVSRYTFAGTLTGFPGLSIPCGTGDNDMPVGLHLTTLPWTERRQLRLAMVLNRVLEN